MSAHAMQQVVETPPVETPQASTPLAEARPAYEDIALLAYALWQERGCPEGSSEEDWFRAEQELAGRPKHERFAVSNDAPARKSSHGSR